MGLGADSACAHLGRGLVGEARLAPRVDRLTQETGSTMERHQIWPLRERIDASKMGGRLVLSPTSVGHAIDFLPKLSVLKFIERVIGTVRW